MLSHIGAKVWRVAAASAALGLAPIVASTVASAQTCGTDYEIKQGDTLAQIATRVYGKASQWTTIFYANQDRLGSNASLLVPGLSIRIPCIASSPQPERLPEAATTPAQASVAAPTQGAFVLSSLVKRIEFLTADGFSPFAGRSLRNGGMLTEILSTAMDQIKAQAQGQFEYGISWVNDWSAHLNPLLATRAFDVGYPWARPDCENFVELDQDGKYRCQRFFFSAPLYENLTLVFLRKDSPIEAATEESLRGKSVCRPAGQSTYELDSGGKNWLKGNVVTLIRPQTVDECFRQLDTGAVDAVVVTDLVGRAAMTELGMTDRIRVIERPIAIGTLHVIVSKTHPHARTMLYYINEALAKLKENGEYDKIVEAHLATFWNAEDQGAGSTATPTSTPAATPEPVPPAVAPAGQKDAPPVKNPSELANGNTNAGLTAKGERRP